MTLRPVVVDLDGTLVHSDMLHESALRLFRDYPHEVFRIPLLLAKGKAFLKGAIASRTQFDPACLPYNVALIDWLKEQKSVGRPIILCTASDQSIAQSIAAHLDIFDDVIASDGFSNLAGEVKAAELVKRYGEEGFDYAGNSAADIAVWKRSHHAIVVNASRAVAAKAEAVAKVEREFPAMELGLQSFARVLRVHQWLKNVLLFVPLFAAHEFFNLGAWASLLVAFFAFSLCASSVYIANDMLDLESDRQHPRKCKRPFASGAVPIWLGVLMAPLLLVCSASLALLVGKPFFLWLVFYFAVTCVYSWLLKRLVIIDCLTLSVLYTLRIVAGAAAIGHSLSFWLLAFSVFLFLSLAFVKRYAELEVQIQRGGEKLHGRGYLTTDASLIQSMGIVSGYCAVMVLALYLNSDDVLILYPSPQFIWGAVMVMLFWVSWMWMQAHRGNMHDDPLVYAVKDKASLLAGAAFTLVLAAGASGLAV